MKNNRRIVNFETVSVGKKNGQNNDGIYVGENFVAVVVGVSNSSNIQIGDKHIEIADIIIEAIRKIDRPDAPVYAKTLKFEEFVQYVNLYIKKYCEKINYSLDEKPLEATAAIYSKYYNQIWLVGDCRAICDKKTIQNELKIDEVFTKLRIELTNLLLQEGYTEEELIGGSKIEREILNNPELIFDYISDKRKATQFLQDMEHIMFETLLECGFSEEDIIKQNLLKKYYTPTELQKYLKNNPNVEGGYGYSVLNGQYTEIKNCRCENLPDNVKQIKLSSDGISIDTLNRSKDLGQVIRTIRRQAESDKLSIGENRTLKSAFKQSIRFPYYSIDDASAITFRIERKTLEEMNEDGRFYI